MSNPVFDLIGKSYANIKEEKVEVTSTNELIVLANDIFDYSTIDIETANYLQVKEIEIKNIFAKAYTELGKVLFEAQEKLSGSNQYDGLFYNWFESLGFKKDKVYSLISRYKLLIGNSDKQEIIERLPLSLSYEIAKEKCPKELKDMVLKGEIKTLKEFKEYKKDSNYENKIEEAIVIVSNIEIDQEIDKIDKSYNEFLNVYKEKIETLNKEKKSEVYKEMKKIEKKLKKILKNIEE